MNIKSHYKMIISIIIVVILVSSMVVYFYPHNSTEYYNNGRSITLRYFYKDSSLLIPNHYHVSSYYNSDGISVYLNTSVEPLAYNLSGGFSSACMPVNMTGSTVNAKYVYVTVTGSDTNVIYGHYNGTVRKKCTVNQNTARLNYSSNMCFIVRVMNICRYLNNNYYNYTVKVSAGKLYNVYYIDTVQDSAVYGFVNKTGTTGADQGLNSEFFAYDLNSSMLYDINITNGNYYLFTVPGNKYEFYSYYNNTMNRIFINNSTEHNIYTMNAPEGSMFTNVYLNTLLGK